MYAIRSYYGSKSGPIENCADEIATVVESNGEPTRTIDADRATARTLFYENDKVFTFVPLNRGRCYVYEDDWAEYFKK